MGVLVPLITAIAGFLLKRLSFRAVKLTLSIFFNSIAISFVLSALYFGFSMLLKIWSFFTDATDQINNLSGQGELFSKALAFAEASGLLDAFNNVMDVFFTVLFLIFARAAYDMGKEAIVIVNRMIQDAIKLI